MSDGNRVKQSKPRVQPGWCSGAQAAAYLGIGYVTWRTIWPVLAVEHGLHAVPLSRGKYRFQYTNIDEAMASAAAAGEPLLVPRK